MEIYYCDGCGMRIKGDATAAKTSDNTRYCDKCAPLHTPVSTAAFKLQKPATGSFKNTGTSALSTETGRKKIVRSEAASKTNNTVMAAAGGGVAAIVIVLYLVFGRGSSEAKVATTAPDGKSPATHSITKTQSPTPAKTEDADRADRKAAEPAKAESAKAASEKQFEIALPAPPVVGTTPEDFRESYARRRLDDLLAQEKKARCPPRICVRASRNSRRRTA